MSSEALSTACPTEQDILTTIEANLSRDNIKDYRPTLLKIYQILWQEPDNSRAYQLLSQCFLKLNQASAALEACFYAVSLTASPNSAWFTDFHRQLTANHHNAQIALNTYQTWLKLSDQDYLNSAKNLYLFNQLTALNCKLLNRKITAKFGLALTYAFLKQSASAQQTAIHALQDLRLWQAQKIQATPQQITTKIDHPLKNVLNYVGQQLQFLDGGKHGLELYQFAVQLFPEDAIFHRNLSVLYRVVSGDVNRSQWHEVESFKLDPSLPSDQELEWLGITLQDQGNTNLCFELYEAVTRLRPAQATIAIAFGQLCLKRGLIEPGLQSLKKAITELATEAQQDQDFIQTYQFRTQQLSDQAENSERDHACARWLSLLQTQPHSKACNHEFVEILLNNQARKNAKFKQEFIGTDKQIQQPIGWHETTKLYLEKIQQLDRYQALNYPSDISLNTSNTLISTLTYEVSLTPAQTLPGYEIPEFKPEPFSHPPLFVTPLPNARVCWGGAVATLSLNIVATIAADQHLLADLSPRFPFPKLGFHYRHPGEHWVFKIHEFPPLTQHPGTVVNLASIAGYGGMANYFHWVIDLLPRISLMQDAGINFADIDLFLVDNFRADFQRESLAALGIPLDRVASIDQHPHLQAKTLIAPSLPGKLATPSRYGIKFLQSTFGQQFGTTQTPWRRLYICRDRARYRRILNETELITKLSQLGFEVIRPEALSFSEQVRLFSEASVVIAPHGAGLTNIVFCQPGAIIIELLAPGYLVPYYWILASEAQLNYFYLIGEGMHGSHLRKIIYPNLLEEDLFININLLMQLLNIANAV